MNVTLEFWVSAAQNYQWQEAQYPHLRFRNVAIAYNRMITSKPTSIPIRKTEWMFPWGKTHALSLAPVREK
jgi:hypothetical protein